MLVIFPIKFIFQFLDSRHIIDVIELERRPAVCIALVLVLYCKRF